MSAKRSPFTSPSNKKAREHLDSRTPQHAEDHRKYRWRREELSWMEKFSHTYMHDEKFNFLGDGIVMNMDGKELSTEEYETLMLDEAEARKEYKVWQEYTEKKTGRKRAGWKTRSNVVKKDGKIIKHRGILQLPITFRPDHSLALHEASKEIEGCPKEQLVLRKTIKGIALKCAKLLQEKSNNEALAIMIHPNEGCLHFHIVYSQTSRDKKRLSTPGVGQSAFPKMGLNLTGTFRCHNNGIDIFDGNIDRGNLYMQRRLKDGVLPADWVVCEYLDGVMEYLRTHTKMGKYFDEAYTAWKQMMEGDMRRPNQESYMGKKHGPLNAISKEEPDLGLGY